jgi:hypothetical protein
MRVRKKIVRCKRKWEIKHSCIAWDTLLPIHSLSKAVHEIRQIQQLFLLPALLFIANCNTYLNYISYYQYGILQSKAKIENSFYTFVMTIFSKSNEQWLFFVLLGISRALETHRFVEKVIQIHIRRESWISSIFCLHSYFPALSVRRE